MKKLLLILIFSAFSFWTYSQQEYPAFSPGIRLSPNLGWISSQVNTTTPNTISNGSPKLGYAIGIMLDYMYKENFGISTEFRVQRLDLGYKLISPALVRDFSVNYQYVEIPISLKMRTVEFGYTRFYAQAGLNLAACTKSSADVTFTPGTKQTNTNVRSTTTPINMGLFIGMGFEYTLAGTTALCAGLSYHSGFIDIYKDPADDVYTINSRYISLDLGVKF